MSTSRPLSSIVADVVAAGPGHPPATIAASSWLEPSAHEPEQIHASFSEQFKVALSECSLILGAPRERGHSSAPSWYPECVRFASWVAGTNVAYLAVVHHDQETPVLLEFGVVSPGEIAARAE